LTEQLQLRRGTASQVAAFTGQQGEVVMDTTNNRLVVNDGATVGGFAAAKLSEVVVGSSAYTTVAASGTLPGPGRYAVTTAGVTLALPSYANPGLVTIKDMTGSSTPNITISGTVDGGSGATLTTPKESLAFAPCPALSTWIAE
jgi:major tropism determinant Mtd-like protein